MCVVNYI